MVTTVNLLLPHLVHTMSQDNPERTLLPPYPLVYEELFRNTDSGIKKSPFI